MEDKHLEQLKKEQLKKMRDELAEKLDAVDYAIHFIESNKITKKKTKKNGANIVTNSAMDFGQSGVENVNENVGRFEQDTDCNMSGDNVTKLAQPAQPQNFCGYYEGGSDGIRTD